MYANTANGFTEWHLRKCNWKNDNVGFQLNRPFLFVTACRGEIIHISRRIHIIRSRVATHLSFPHFLQTKWRLVFSQGAMSVWVGERNFSYNQCSNFYWAPTLPTLSWDDKNRRDEIHQWFQNNHAGISVDKKCELNNFTVTNIRSKHKR